LRRIEVFWYLRARVNLEGRSKEPSRAVHSLRQTGCGRRGREHSPGSRINLQSEF
jgi:hypothetical protein